MAEKSSFMGGKSSLKGKKSSFKLFGKIEFPSKRTKNKPAKYVDSLKPSDLGQKLKGSRSQKRKNL